MSNSKYKEIFNYFINEAFFQKCKDEKKQLIVIEEFIKKCINVYWCNSNFYFDGSLDDFLCIFYNFITENKTKSFTNPINNNILDDFSRKYIEFISLSLQTLFNNFCENSLTEFGLSLYNFIIEFKNNYKTNDVIELILRIDKSFEIPEEKIGIISMICFNKNFISEIQKKVNELKTIYYENDINKISSDLCLNNYENYVLSQIIYDKKMKKGKISDKNQLFKIDNKNNLSSNIGTNGKDNIIMTKNDEIITNLSEKINNGQNILNKREIKNNDNLIKFDNIIERNPIQQNIFEKNSNNNEDKDNRIYNNVRNNISIKNEENLNLKSLENENKELRQIISNINAKLFELEKSNELNNKTIRELLIYKELNEKAKNKMKKELGEVKHNVDILKKIHEKIYFRDVSKFYINEFTKIYGEIKGVNLYNTCQNILSFNFYGKSEEFKTHDYDCKSLFEWK